MFFPCRQKPYLKSGGGICPINKRRFGVEDGMPTSGKLRTRAVKASIGDSSSHTYLQLFAKRNV